MMSQNHKFEADKTCESEKHVVASWDEKKCNKNENEQGRRRDRLSWQQMLPNTKRSAMNHSEALIGRKQKKRVLVVAVQWRKIEPLTKFASLLRYIA